MKFMHGDDAKTAYLRVGRQEFTSLTRDIRERAGKSANAGVNQLSYSSWNDASVGMPCGSKLKPTVLEA
jgi:hypothetical protein